MDDLIVNATLKQGTAGFYLNDRFYGQIYYTQPENSNKCELRTDDFTRGSILIDLDTVTIQDSAGADVTPVTNTEKLEKINEYTAWVWQS